MGDQKTPFHSEDWKATRAEGLQNLAAFAPSAGKRYAQNRNYDHGPGEHNYVSQLSPYIRCRLVSEQEVLAATLKEHSLSALDKFVQEVFWRTYWKGWLEQRPSIWTGYLTDTRLASAVVEDDAELGESFRRAIHAETGIDAFDHWVLELRQTGYLHNHARMWFASIWIFTLKLPWVLGARFFYQNLLDGDPASNTLSWRWVAGLQTIGKHYVARPDNIEKYTNGRFVPTNLSTGSTPLRGSDHSDPTPIPTAHKGGFDDAPFLLLTEEDLSSETWLNISPLSVLGVLIDDPQHQRSQIVRNFRLNALVDGVERWCDRSGAHRTPIANGSDLENIVEQIVGSKCKSVITPYAPVGPTAQWLGRLGSLLAERQITLNLPRRSYDDLCWPSAKAGFFTFKKRIPDFLDKLGSR